MCSALGGSKETFLYGLHSEALLSLKVLSIVARPQCAGLQSMSGDPRRRNQVLRLLSGLGPCIAAAFPSCLGAIEEDNYLLCLEANTRGW